MRDAKDREIRVGDILWVPMADSGRPFLGVRRVLEVREDRVIVVSVPGRDNGYRYASERQTRPAPLYRTDRCLIDLEERH